MDFGNPWVSVLMVFLTFVLFLGAIGFLAFPRGHSPGDDERKK